MISSLSATLSAVLLVGYAGVHPSVGRGYEFVAITAVVLGGVVLGGGRGWIVAAVAGAFVLEALFLLLNIAGVPSTLRDAVQGVIIIAAVAYSGVAFRARRRSARTPPASPDHGEGARRARWRDGSVRITCPRRRGCRRNQRRLEMRRSLKIATTSVALVGLSPWPAARPTRT